MSTVGGQIWNAEALDASTNKFSKKFKVEGSSFSVQLSWTGTSQETTTLLQASCKANPDETTETDWVDCEDADGNPVTLEGPNGSANKSLAEFSGSGAWWYRVKYDPASGTGTISGWVAAKDA